MAELRIAARVDQLDTVIAFLEEQLEMMDAPMKAVMQLSIALEEMYVNVASYAYGEGEGDAVILVEEESGEDGRMAVVTVIDEGAPYNPLEKEDPDITLSAEERKIGGLGIYMVKKSMDVVDYKNEDGRNVFVMKKKI